MAGVLRTVGKVAGVVATVATFTGNPAVAAIASAVAVVSSTLGQALAKPPTARGQVNERIIGANNPLPYLMGRSYSGGVQVYDNAYGGEVNDVDNPYRWFVSVHSCAGPVQSIESTEANFSTVSFTSGAATGYYADYWWRDTQLGATPETGALTPNFSGAPSWGASYKLSGMCAVGHNLKWSKKAKRFAGGQTPVIGQIVEGVKAYDPRLDGTYPGGSGAHRIDDETTWAYTRNPALHAIAYAYGRYSNGKKVFGIDLGGAAIDLASAVAWANVCDANGWHCDGTIYEGGNQSKWDNLKAICQAGGCVPVKVGGVLYFDFQSARTALATITRDDFSDGPVRDQMGRGWKSRTNTLTPRYRSESHQWNYVQSEAIAVAAFVTEDGQTKADELQFDLVTDKDQAAELGTYEVYQRRERGPFIYPMKPHWRDYQPGDCFTLSADVSPTGVAIKVVLRARSVDPSTGAVRCTFEGETDAKHAAAIGATGTSPATVTFPSGQDIDDAYSVNNVNSVVGQSLIENSYVSSGGSALVAATDTSVTIVNHTRNYSDKSVSVTGGTLTTEDDGSTAIAASTLYFVYYDDTGRAGGAVTLKATTSSTDAINSAANPDRHFVGSITSDTAGGTGTTGGGSSPPGVIIDDWDISNF